MQVRFVHQVSTPEALAAADACGASTLLLPAAAPAGELRRLACVRGMRVGIFVAVPSADNAGLDAILDALVPDLPEGVVLADCRGRADLQKVSVKLAVRETLANQPEGVVKILAMAAQSPAGVLALPGLAGGIRRLAGLVWEPAALARATGVVPTASTMKMAQSQVVFAAAAAGVPAFFVPPPLPDAATVVRRCAKARDAGYAGMILQTPSQFAAIRQGIGMIDKRP